MRSLLAYGHRSLKGLSDNFHLLSNNIRKRKPGLLWSRFFCVFEAFICDLRGFLYAVDKLYLEVIALLREGIFSYTL